MLHSAFEEDLPDHKKEQKKVKRGKPHLNSRDQDLCADRSFVRASLVPQTVKKIHLQCRKPGLIPEWGRTPGDGNGYLPGEAHGQRSLTGYSLWGHKESDTTEHL